MLVLALAAGCRRESVERGAVRGEVSFAGKPVERGHVVFLPQGNQPGASASAEIVGGKYELPRETGPSVGSHRVEILATRSAGKREAGTPFPPGTLVEVTEQFIPPRFNHQSVLTAEIASGDNVVDFALKAP